MEFGGQLEAGEGRLAKDLRSSFQKLTPFLESRDAGMDTLLLVSCVEEAVERGSRLGIDPLQACQYFQRAVDLKPDDHEAHRFLAAASIKAGISLRWRSVREWRKAQALFKGAVMSALACHSLGGDKAHCFHLAAKAQMACGEYNQADNNLQRAALLEPLEPDMMQLLQEAQRMAWIQQQAENYDNLPLDLVLERLERLSAASPLFTPYLFTVYFRIKAFFLGAKTEHVDDFREARDVLRRVAGRVHLEDVVNSRDLHWVLLNSPLTAQHLVDEAKLPAARKVGALLCRDQAQDGLSAETSKMLSIGLLNGGVYDPSEEVLGSFVCTLLTRLIWCNELMPGAMERLLQMAANERIRKSLRGQVQRAVIKVSGCDKSGAINDEEQRRVFLRSGGAKCMATVMLAEEEYREAAATFLSQMSSYEWCLEELADIQLVVEDFCLPGLQGDLDRKDTLQVDDFPLMNMAAETLCKISGVPEANQCLPHWGSSKAPFMGFLRSNLHRPPKLLLKRARTLGFAVSVASARRFDKVVEEIVADWLLTIKGSLEEEKARRPIKALQALTLKVLKAACKPVSEADRLRCCGNCGDKQSLNPMLVRCSQCKQAFYCSRRCQQTAWVTGHRAICRGLPRM